MPRTMGPPTRTAAIDDGRPSRRRTGDDPAVAELPEAVAGNLELCADPLEAAASADALVLCTAWPEYLEVSAADVAHPLRAASPFNEACRIDTHVDTKTFHSANRR